MSGTQAAAAPATSAVERLERALKDSYASKRQSFSDMVKSESKAAQNSAIHTAREELLATITDELTDEQVRAVSDEILRRGEVARIAVWLKYGYHQCPADDCPKLAGKSFRFCPEHGTERL